MAYSFLFRVMSAPNALLLLFCLLGSCVVPEAAAIPVALTQNGNALLQISVSPTAGSETLSAARNLAEMLQRISGARFEFSSDPQVPALRVGIATDWPEMLSAIESGRLASPDPTRREDYLLRSGPHGVLLVGNTPAAVHHAVWDFLERLGYRQYFPGPRWEVLPRDADLSVDVDVIESPAFYARRIWFGFGALPERAAAYQDWCRKNRVAAGIDLRTGHAYDGILRRHKAEFEEHPEYIALVKGRRQGAKLCISNPGLRALVAADAVAEFEKNPQIDSVSCDPSDGGGWCECGPCQSLGSISDRALFLANETARALEERYPGRLVGMYAYNEHSPPPSVPGHPSVVVSVATAFINGGFTVDQLLTGWSRKVRTLGIREYYSVNTWDRDLPGAARGGNLSYLVESIPRFHASGVRFLSAESSDNFGPNGLGYFIASRMLWDVRTAAHIEEFKEDFFSRAFGPAKEPIRRFYELLDGAKRRPLCDDLLGRMYRLLSEAFATAPSEGEILRIADLALYTRYVELYSDYSTALGDERQGAFEKLIRHAWRIRSSGMVHTLALYRDLVARDKSVFIPSEAAWNKPPRDNPWKQDPEFTFDEIRLLVDAGVRSRPLLDFESVPFSEKLVPAARSLSLAPVKRGSMGLYLRGVRDFWTYLEKAPATVVLKAASGLIYTNRGPAQLEVFPVAEAEGRSVHAFEIPPDKEEHEIRFESALTGLHRIVVSDRGVATRVEWPEGTPMTLWSDPMRPPHLHGRWTLYAYVPRGTSFIGGFSNGVGDLLDPAGKKAFTFSNKPGYFRVPVPVGEDGKLWCFSNCVGDRLLMTIPPCLAADASELLLPEEVVRRDSQAGAPGK